MDHGIGGGEVEASATGLEADQKHQCVAVLKGINGFLALAGGPGQLAVGNPVFAQ